MAREELLLMNSDGQVNEIANLIHKYFRKPFFNAKNIRKTG